VTAFFASDPKSMNWGTAIKASTETRQITINISTKVNACFRFMMVGADNQ
jgi:hypothetical protein